MQREECNIEDLILRIQHGDIEAFEEIFQRYKNEAVRTAYLITGKMSICEDIAQEAFIQCYKHIGELHNPSGFRAWFYQILTRTAWKYGKSASREVPTENIMEKADQNSFDLAAQQYFTQEENRTLYAEINRLEQKQRTVIILYYFNELSTKEIAKATGYLEGTVKSRLFTARKQLKAKLDSYNHAEKEYSSYETFKVV